MRKYKNQEKIQLQELYCNCCGKKIHLEEGNLREGVYCGQVQWGYFSKKDGEVHSFDLCEDCYDKWITGFQIPVEKKMENELL